MSKVAPAPLKAGIISADTKAAPPTEPEVKTETKSEPTVEAKTMTSTDDTVGGADVANPMGADAIRAGMDHLLAYCKAMTEAMATSDLPDNQEFAKSMSAKVAGLIGEHYEHGTKTFPDHTDLFNEANDMAANYAVLDEQPDEADAGTAEGAELLDEARDDETKAADETTDEDEKKDDEENKSAASVVTTKEFNDWHNKTFGEMNAREYLEGVDQRLAKLETATQEHREALEAFERIEIARR